MSNTEPNEPSSMADEPPPMIPIIKTEPMYTCLDWRVKAGLLSPQDSMHMELRNDSPVQPDTGTDTAATPASPLDKLAPISSPSDQSMGSTGQPKDVVFQESANSWSTNQSSANNWSSNQRPYNSAGRVITCFNCQKEGHCKRDCPQPRFGGGGHSRADASGRPNNRFQRPIHLPPTGQYQPQPPITWTDTGNNLSMPVDGDRPPIGTDSKGSSISSLAVEPPQQLTVPTVIDSFPDLGDYYLNESLSDVSFVIDGQSLFAHKFVLSAKCPAFELLFYGTQPKPKDIPKPTNDVIETTATPMDTSAVSNDTVDDKAVDENESKMDVETNDETKESLTVETNDESKESLAVEVKEESIEIEVKEEKPDVVDTDEHTEESTETSDQTSVSPTPVEDIKQVDITDTSLEAFKLFLHYFYTETIELKDSDGNDTHMDVIKDLFKLTNRYEMPRLVQLIERHMIANLKFETLVQVYQLAIDYDLKQLNEALDPFTRQHGNKVVDRKVFITDSKEVTVRMLSAIKSVPLKFRGLKMLVDAKPDWDTKVYKEVVDLPKCTIDDIDAMDQMKLYTREELYPYLRQICNQLVNQQNNQLYNQYNTNRY